ncbi:head-tail connector protein [Saccharothrix saharensis]|uniref:head-tail connector protein n=1 Tax=Saccharothrix saharensis TaxID=571190 RepID=UPI0036ACCC91
MAWAPDYCTSAELKSYLKIDQDDTADDVQIALAITAASRAIDLHTRRQFGNTGTAQDRYYTASWDRRRSRWTVAIDDLMTVAGLTVSYDVDDDGTYSGEIDAYQLKDVNAAAEGRPWTSLVVHPGSSVLPGTLEAGVEVHAVFGWTSVPTTIKQACLLQASRLFSRRDSPYGVAGSPENGSEIRLLSKLDPDVALMVKAYRKAVRPR